MIPNDVEMDWAIAKTCKTVGHVELVPGNLMSFEKDFMKAAYKSKAEDVIIAGQFSDEEILGAQSHQHGENGSNQEKPVDNIGSGRRTIDMAAHGRSHV